MAATARALPAKVARRRQRVEEFVGGLDEPLGPFACRRPCPDRAECRFEPLQEKGAASAQFRPRSPDHRQIVGCHVRIVIAGSGRCIRNDYAIEQRCGRRRYVVSPAPSAAASSMRGAGAEFAIRASEVRGWCRREDRRRRPVSPAWLSPAVRRNSGRVPWNSPVRSIVTHAKSTDE